MVPHLEQTVSAFRMCPKGNPVGISPVPHQRCEPLQGVCAFTGPHCPWETSHLRHHFPQEHPWSQPQAFRLPLPGEDHIGVRQRHWAFSTVGRCWLAG